MNEVGVHSVKPFLVFQTCGAHPISNPRSSLSRGLSQNDVARIFGVTIASVEPYVALLAVRIDAIMPEAAGGSSTRFAQSLFEPSSQLSIPEYYKLLVYQVSNGMHEIVMDDCYLDDMTEIIGILESSGVTSSKLPVGEHLGPTIDAFVEKLFQEIFILLNYRINEYSSLEDDDDIERARELVIRMLHLGQTPNIRIEDMVLTSSPLQLAVELNEAHLANQLLDAGADPNFLSKRFDRTIDRAQRSDERDSGHYYDLNPEMIEVLGRFVDAGISQGEKSSALISAIDRRSISLADKLIQVGANVLDTSSVGYHWHGMKIGAIGFAADIEDEAKAQEFMIFLLRHAQAAYPSRSQADFITADVILIATKREHHSILEFLLGIGCDVAGTESEGVTALHIAAFKGCYSLCERLLEYGSLVDGPSSPTRAPPPMILAALEGHESIVQLLHRHGADLNGNFAFNAVPNFWHTSIWPQFDPDTPRARLSYRLSDLGISTISPVGAAILGCKWNNETYRYLTKHGARLPDWAIYYGAHNLLQSGIVEVALKGNADVNCKGKNEKTPLQTVLSSSRTALRMFEQSMNGIEEFRSRCVRLCFELLNAGAVLLGGEVEMAVFLNNWDLVESILLSHPYGLARNDSPISLLESAFLSGSEDMVHRVFGWDPGAYHDGALCAAVCYASEHQSTKHLLRLLKNRPMSKHATYLEGIAMGLAAWGAEAEVLKTLGGNLGTPSEAAHPICPSCKVYSHDEIRQALLSFKFGKKELPFWHDKSLNGTETLLLTGQSPQDPQLKALGHCAGEQSGDIVADLDRDKISKTQENTRFDDIYYQIDLAVHRGKLDDAKVLLFAGVDGTTTCSIDKHIAGRYLRRAVQWGDLSVSEFLLKAGAEIDTQAARDGGLTALQQAAIDGRVGIAKILIDWGADINASRAGKSGRTALEGAAMRGRIDMLQFLLSMGAETGGKGRLQYLRAIKFAECKWHLVAAKMLREHRDWIIEDDNLWRELEQLGSRWEQYGKITRCLMNGAEVRWIDE